MRRVQAIRRTHGASDETLSGRPGDTPPPIAAPVARLHLEDSAISHNLSMILHNESRDSRYGGKWNLLAPRRKIVDQGRRVHPFVRCVRQDVGFAGGPTCTWADRPIRFAQGRLVGPLQTLLRAWRGFSGPKNWKTLVSFNRTDRVFQFWNGGNPENLLQRCPEVSLLH